MARLLWTAVCLLTLQLTIDSSTSTKGYRWASALTRLNLPLNPHIYGLLWHGGLFIVVTKEREIPPWQYNLLIELESAVYVTQSKDLVLYRTGGGWGRFGVRMEDGGLGRGCRDIQYHVSLQGSVSLNHIRAYSIAMKRLIYDSSCNELKDLADHFWFHPHPPYWG